MKKISEALALRIENAFLKRQLADKDVELAVAAAAIEEGIKLSEYGYDLTARAFIPHTPANAAEVVEAEAPVLIPVEKAPETSPDALEHFPA